MMFLLVGFLLMHDTWKTLDLDRINETVDVVKEIVPQNPLFLPFS